YWGLSRAGTSLPVTNTCEVCDCPMCPNCAVCGRAFAKVEEITPGAVFDFSWDGRLWRLVSRTCGGGGMCEMPETVAPGPLSVQVQYGHSFKIDTSAGADDEWVDQPLLMTTKVFTHPSPQVEIVVDP
ncbi:MAG TPA: hypothetical protein VGG33_11500, partial [Polyangia bacterium]